MDLTHPGSVDRSYRRLAFARAIGAQIVNTIAGPTSGLAGFQANIAAIGGRAADLGLTLALENHGDLVNRGRQIVQLIESIGIPAVRLNYDTGNAWYYAKGTLDPAEELAFESRWRAPEAPTLPEIRGIIRRSLCALSDALA